MGGATGGWSIAASSALGLTKVVLAWGAREMIGNSAAKPPPLDPLVQLRELINDESKGLERVQDGLSRISVDLKNGFGLVLSQLSEAEQSLVEIMQFGADASPYLVAGPNRPSRGVLPPRPARADGSSTRSCFPPHIFPGNFVARRLLSEVLLRASPDKWDEDLNHADLAARYAELPKARSVRRRSRWKRCEPPRRTHCGSTPIPRRQSCAMCLPPITA